MNWRSLRKGIRWLVDLGDAIELTWLALLVLAVLVSSVFVVVRFCSP
jgi:hypothetical protein